MIAAFGGPFLITDDTGLPAAERPHLQDFADWVAQHPRSTRLEDQAIMRFRCPRPTAAFSPQDTVHPNYERARQQTGQRGFVPIERGTGGRLTLFDECSLGITIIAPHANAHQYMMQRYVLLSKAIAAALGALDIDARIGELPDEYCPGKFSVNAEGRIKIAGVAQRMNQRAFQMGAIISVVQSREACAGIAEAYQTMGLNFNPDTYGAITDLRPSLSFASVRDAVVKSVTAAVNEA